MPLAVEPLFQFGDPAAVAYLFVGAALFVAIGALSHAEERAFSAAFAYLALGIVASIALELAFGHQLIHPVRDHELLEILSTAAVIVAVFATGLRVRRAFTLRAWASPLRLIAVGMPLTIAAVAGWAWGVMGLSLGAAIALGAALAPTDPVLAGDLGLRPPGEGKREEEEEQATEAEFAVTNEAGLNDGAALPFLFLGIIVASGEEGRLVEWVWADLGYSVAAAVVLGAGLGYALGALTSALRERGLLRFELDGWVGVAAAPLVYGAAEAAGAYGFIAVFLAGLAFRRHEVGHEYNRRVHDGAGVAKNFAELAVILAVGSMITIAGLSEPGIAGWALAPVLLLVVRPLAVAASLVGSGIVRGERLYLAWFGVKGIASINYMALAVAAGAFGGEDERVLVWTILVVVAVSILVHGVTGTPLSRRLLRPV